MAIKIGFISLGCPKNEVDAEHMLYKLQEKGYEMVDVPYEADVVIINTCAFIDDAKKEAIDNILQMADYKKDGMIKKIIVTGCLAERYKTEVLEEMPEIDGIIGIGNNDDICDVVERVLNDECVQEFADKEELNLEGSRAVTSPEYWAYLKIADGCSNNCAYCSIPSIRGKYRSRPIETIVEEAEALAKRGAKEIILIAQDTTRYGLDLYGSLKLPALLRELVKVEGIEWIRMLYCYPERITDELLDTMAENDKILNYIDLPLQHADKDVLKRMNRVGDEENLLNLIGKIREKMSNCILRTTFITGFPGETEENFETLSRFVDEAKFDRLGCFAYSREEGTPAYDMDDQIDEDVKKERGEAIMQQQFTIFEQKQKNLIGTVQRCIVEGYDSYSDSYFGRTWMDAPEIDSIISFTGDGDYYEGDMVDVKIFDTDDIDLIGEIVE